MNILKIGVTSKEVERWQYFLYGEELYNGIATGEFDNATKEATKAFQKKHGLVVDGIVGNRTMAKALSLGHILMIDEKSEYFPPFPNFKSLSLKQKEAKFGEIKWRPKPESKTEIIITNNWESVNMITIQVPQLAKIRMNGSASISFHEKGAAQMQKLWQDWENAGLLPLILTWDGAFNPRFVRGGEETKTLSPHAFGIAFDINYQWNKLGHVPALKGEKGSVRELVKIANENGFYWGGHFSKRKDGMHFEIAKLIN